MCHYVVRSIIMAEDSYNQQWQLYFILILGVGFCTIPHLSNTLRHDYVFLNDFHSTKSIYLFTTFKAYNGVLDRIVFTSSTNLMI